MTKIAPYFAGQTLDDIMRDVVEALRMHGTPVSATRGSSVELTGVLLQLENPLARLSRTESRGRPFSALGEFCWYLRGADDLASIEYYIPLYRNDADVDVLRGAYGPRLVGPRDVDQLDRIIAILSERSTSRRAVIRLFDASDLRTGQKDVPCTCTLQFLVRERALHAITYMRSNDAFRGLPHDVFCFTLLQEWIARRLGASVGCYKHIVGSLHLYDTDRSRIDLFLNEGFQSTQSPMPNMPSENPEGSLRRLLEAELILRAPTVNEAEIATMLASADPYWADLIRLLWFFRKVKDAEASGHDAPNDIADLKGQMSTDIYNAFIDRRLQLLRNDFPDSSHA